VGDITGVDEHHIQLRPAVGEGCGQLALPGGVAGIGGDDPAIVTQ
jgi:hypothetical protein